MLQSIVIVLERTPCVLGRIDEDALHLPGELLLQRFQRQQVIAEDQPVVEDVVIGHAMLGVVRLLAVFEQDPWLQLRPVVFANSGEFEFLLARHGLC